LSKVYEVARNKGTTLAKINREMTHEQMGSAMYHPRYSISNDEIITPKLRLS
jgi:hypothetical protein